MPRLPLTPDPYCMIAIIDNYDSFTYNLVQRLGEIDPEIEIEVYRNDQVTAEEIAGRRPTHLIVSPGPCTPREAGISKEAIRRLGRGVPVLGVCLGHQSIGEAFGGRVVRAAKPMHGKTSLVHHDGRGVFEGLENPFVATRYHSLIVEAESLPEELEVTAWCEDEDAPGRRIIMGLRHRGLPIEGVQFHPESFLTRCGVRLLENFLGAGWAVAHAAGKPVG